MSRAGKQKPTVDEIREEHARITREVGNMSPWPNEQDWIHVLAREVARLNVLLRKASPARRGREKRK